MNIPQTFLNDPFLTPKDIMEITKLKRSTVYYKIRNEMKHHKFGRSLRVRQSDFLMWMERYSRDPFDLV